ncbi:MAG: ECF transporter S component [Bacilli bacterium]|nr:ECF transporter S component [Bacilli bacterium]
MRNEKVRDMAYYAIFVAIIVIMSFTPLGYISFGGVSITLVHIPVLIAAFTMGRKGGLVAGVTMGIISMIVAWTMPKSFGDFPFRNPLCSLLPRAVFGFVSGLVAELVFKKFKNKAVSTTIVGGSSIALTALHTVMVLPLMYVCAGWVPELSDWVADNKVMSIIGAVFVSNGIIEMILAGIITAPIVLVLRPVYIKGRKK